MTQAFIDDGGLVALAQAGDSGAFAALVARHRGAVFRFARRHAEGDAAAEDLLQDTFLTAMRSLPGFRGEGSFLGWLLAIARSSAMHARRNRQREALDDTDGEGAEGLETVARAAGFDAPANPEDLASRAERRGVLERALNQLDSEEREVLVLRDVEGLSGDEAAVALGLSLPAMKSRLHRARLRLVAALNREDV